MNRAELVDAFLAFHDPKAQEADMVYEIWEDGEVTLTKGGSLYGQRSLHSVWLPQYMVLDKRLHQLLPVELMPKKNHDGSHGCIQLASGRNVNAVLELLFGKCTYNNKWYV